MIFLGTVRSFVRFPSGNLIAYMQLACKLRRVSALREGEVAEWSKAPVSKTGMGKPIESSNLSLSESQYGILAAL